MSLAQLSLAAELGELDSFSFILDKIEAAIDPDILISKLGPCSKRVKNLFTSLIDEAAETAKPRAAFKVCRVSRLDDSQTCLDQSLFKSRLLNFNLSKHELAFAYVATEGAELSGWAAKLSGAGRALAWYIRYAALKLAEKKLNSFIKSSFGLKQLSSMNPGALAAWTREEQRPMFALLNPLPEIIGVELRPNFWMSPDLASTGILFETEHKFYNCQYCPLSPCEHRKTAYLGPWEN